VGRKKGSTYIMSEYQKQAIRQSRIGYTPSAETCTKISEALKGHAVSARTRALISDGARKHRYGGYVACDKEL